MAYMKLFEVTLKAFIGAENEQCAEDEMYRSFGTGFVSMELKEIKAGFRVHAHTENDEVQF